MLTRIDARELAEWVEFYTLEPWGSGEDDFRAGTIASAAANAGRLAASAHPGIKLDGEPFEPADFFQSLQKSRKLTLKEKLKLWATNGDD